MNFLDIEKELEKYTSKNRKKTNERFFKTGKGEYGEHDEFLGISNPNIRLVAKKYKDCSFVDLQKLIDSKYNEKRLCALVILIEQYRKGNRETKEKIYNFYVKNLNQVNNWNLVDLSAPHTIGEYLFECDNAEKVLDTLAKSDFHWNRRICILATWAFIKRNEFELTLKYAKQFLDDEEDLMNKATGWMLREIYKRDSNVCEDFLKKNYNELPRVTLRYAIEKMTESKRKIFLKGTFCQKNNNKI